MYKNKLSKKLHLLGGTFEGGNLKQSCVKAHVKNELTILEENDPSEARASLITSQE
jgi:hypothetical protein